MISKSRNGHPRRHSKQGRVTRDATREKGEMVQGRSNSATMHHMPYQCHELVDIQPLPRAQQAQWHAQFSVPSNSKFFYILFFPYFTNYKLAPVALAPNTTPMGTNDDGDNSNDAMRTTAGGDGYSDNKDRDTPEKSKHQRRCEAAQVQCGRGERVGSGGIASRAQMYVLLLSFCLCSNSDSIASTNLGR